MQSQIEDSGFSITGIDQILKGLIPSTSYLVLPKGEENT